jgi:hypothetical protein
MSNYRYMILSRFISSIGVFIFCLLNSQIVLAQPLPPGSGHGSGGDAGIGSPSSVVEQATVSPGSKLLGIDALQFGGSYAVSSFSIQMDYDTALIQINGIESANISGTWNLSLNGNLAQIDFTAAAGQSHSLNGRIFTLNVIYVGGFQADFLIGEGTVFYNVSQQPIENVAFTNGWLKQTTPTGQVSVSNEGGVVGQQVEFDVGLQGSGFQQVQELHLRIAYNVDKLSFSDIVPGVIVGAEVVNHLGVLYITWNNPQQAFNAFTYKKIFGLVFNYLQGGSAGLTFLPGSYVKANGQFVPIGLNHGQLTQWYQLALEVVPEGAGAVTGEGNYPPGASVTVSATAISPYFFLHWTSSGTVVSTQAVYSFFMPSADIELIAHFGSSAFNLNLLVNPSQAGTVSGAGVYEAGTIVNINATPHPGYAFLNWSDDDEVLSYEPEFVFEMPENDLSLTASFEPLIFTVNLIAFPEGSAQLTGGGYYATGAAVNVEAIPDEGYSFLYWKENGQIVSNQASYSFLMPPNNRSLTAHLSAESYAVMLLSDPPNGGQLSGAGNYDVDDEVFVNALANPGFDFVHWTNGTDVLSDEPAYTFIMPATDLELTAVFGAVEFQLTLSAVPPKSALLSGSGNYFEGDNVIVNAQPAQGYQFLYWKDGDEIVSEQAVYSFTMPAVNLHLTAHLTLIEFQVTAVPNQSDWGETTGSGTYLFGETAVLNAFPFEGYEFVFWAEGNAVVSYNAEFAFEVYQNRELTAFFRIPQSCSPPHTLQAQVIDEYTARLSWLPGGFESGWDLLWGPSGFDTVNQGNYIGELAFTNYLLKGLEAGTAYDFYVRARCSPDIQSKWAGPGIFTTQYVFLDEAIAQQQYMLFPNPASNVVYLSAFSYSTETLQIQLVDSGGRIVKPHYFEESPGKIVIFLDGLPPGVYLVILGNNLYKSIKLLVL